MKTIEIIRNSVMQCIERIAKLSKIVEKVDNSLKLQEQNIENGKVYDSVMSNFVISQFKNFTYLYYTENGEIKSILFNDGNVDSPNVPNYTISGKPVSYKSSQSTSKVVFKDFDTSAVTNMHEMFKYCRNLTTLDLSSFDTSAVTNMAFMFYNCNNLTTIIGNHTLEEVQDGTIKALKGTKVSLNLSYSPLLERASILALFYGLADLTGNTKQTISLHSTAKARLTAEDIKIATDKNWDVQ